MLRNLLNEFIFNNPSIYIFKLTISKHCVDIYTYKHKEIAIKAKLYFNSVVVMF